MTAIALPRPRNALLDRLRTIQLGLAARGAVGVGLARQRGGNGLGLGLLNCLVAYWTLDEASGTRQDSHGSNSFSDTGGVGNTTGQINNAALFTGGNKLSGTYSALDVAGCDFTIAFWDKPPTGNWMHILGKGNAGWPFNFTEFSIMQWSGGGPNYLFGIQGNYYARITRSGSSYDFIVASFASGVGLYLSQNNDTPVFVATPGVTISNTGGAFSVGNQLGAHEVLNGPIDEIGFWKSTVGGGGVLTAAQRTALYNSGAGLAYAAFT